LDTKDCGEDGKFVGETAREVLPDAGECRWLLRDVMAAARRCGLGGGTSRFVLITRCGFGADIADARMSAFAKDP